MECKLRLSSMPMAYLSADLFRPGESNEEPNRYVAACAACGPDSRVGSANGHWKRDLRGDPDIGGDRH